MSRLKDFESQRDDDSNGEDEAEVAGHTENPRFAEMDEEMSFNFIRRRKGKRHTRNTGYDEDESYSKSIDLDKTNIPTRRPMVAKQRLLHLLTTEVAVNTKLYGEMATFCAVFESWDSLLPHETILSVFENILGASEIWRGFFKRFLCAPLKFFEDGPEAPRCTRRRGTPASHVLSDVFSEAVLFCLDIAVNLSTGGNVLWRMQDDLWFWLRHLDIVEPGLLPPGMVSLFRDRKAKWRD